MHVTSREDSALEHSGTQQTPEEGWMVCDQNVKNQDVEISPKKSDYNDEN